ncbi:MAG: hypothetical protein KC684_06640 [Candidatus Omnitrophica bacterium]|nr:hypothetical protein [Candidatus Omnitrophota bacterium]
MIIRICDIKPKGLVVEEQFSPEYIGFTEKDHLQFITPVDITAEVHKIDLTIFSRVTAKGRFKSPCYRTLEMVEQEWQGHFSVDVEINSDTEEIDLGEEIRQEIILRVPDRVLSPQGQKMTPKIQTVEEEKNKTYRPFEKLKDL